MTRDNPAAAIDHHRIDEAELKNRISNALDLPLRMCPGFAIRLPQRIQGQHQWTPG
jgi:hypothetical protein